MANQPPVLVINPPLINSSNPWATTLDDLRALHACPSTGAVTTRTSLIKGFSHDPEKHQYVFLEPVSHTTSHESKPSDAGLAQNASLNSLGYSPLTLEDYLGFIKNISSKHATSSSKGFIVSVTGNPSEVAECYVLVATAQQNLFVPLAMEINLSCPNIPGAPPPAYSGASLRRYIDALQAALAAHPNLPRVPFGLKTPPYTHSTEFETLVDALVLSSTGPARGVCPVSFITATNTLGSCMAFAEDGKSLALPRAGIGGMAGAPLHPLALGNVATIRRMLDKYPRELGHISIIGIGGVLDAAGYSRMKSAGASVVGVGTGLGLKGVGIFEDIEKGLAGKW